MQRVTIWRASARERGRYFDGQECFGRLQPGAYFGDTDRPAKTKALHGMHTRRAQEQLLIGGLHALRRYLHSKASAETDNCVHNGCGIGRLFDRPNETAIDLQLVERKAA